LGEHSDEAKQAIEYIKVIEPEWQSTLKKNTAYSYRTFIKKYPNTSQARSAKNRLSDLESVAWNNAIKSKSPSKLDNFSKTFPESSRNNQIEKLKIDWEVDKIFSQEHGILPPMDRSTTSSMYSSNEINVANNTSYRLTILYSGLESKKITIEKGAEIKFELPNGEFRVTATVNDDSVIPYAGTENLKGGIYESVFYIQSR